MPSFTAHPLAVRALSLDLPDGPMADLACGPSGSALLAAAQGRRVTAVDISEVALWLLGDEARHRGLGGLITLVHADLSSWSPRPGSHALVLCTGFWAADVFAAAADSGRPGRSCWPGRLTPAAPGSGTRACARSGAWRPANPPPSCQPVSACWIRRRSCTAGSSSSARCWPAGVRSRCGDGPTR